jgi:UDP-N-acetylmuramoylalanine--D-glutamate ligase
MIWKNLKKHMHRSKYIYKEFFKDKRITVMGLGLLGGVGDIAFLAESGADLIVTDLKSKKELEPSLKILRKFKNIKYTLGKHDTADFSNRDLIIKAPSTPLDSIYIKEAKENKIPITMWAALFSEFAMDVGVKVVGVTGTRGKTTTTVLITHILKSAHRKVIFGGNVQGTSMLPSLPKLTSDTVVVLELDSWKLQGFNDLKISPNISVFTNFLPDHMGYYNGDMKKYFADKANIFKYQNKNDILVAGKQVLPFIKKWGGKIKSKVMAPKDMLPTGWKFNLLGTHNEHNAMLAIAVARLLHIKDKEIKKALESFKGVSGRLEFIGIINSIKIYNDNNSTTPDATIAGLRAVGDKKVRKVVLIIGGDNKFLDMSGLLKEIPKFCSKVILFKERGTDLIRDKVFEFKKKGIDVYEEEGLQNTVRRAFTIAKKGETILYSPAFFSFGKYFKNEYDRGDQFIKIVKSLK